VGPLALACLRPSGDISDVASGFQRRVAAVPVLAGLTFEVVEVLEISEKSSDSRRFTISI
jgi:hypothetical protein